MTVYVEDDSVLGFNHLVLRSPDLDQDLDVDADDYAILTGGSCTVGNRCRDFDFSGTCTLSPGGSDGRIFHEHLNHGALLSASTDTLVACPAGDAERVAFELRGQAALAFVEVDAWPQAGSEALPCCTEAKVAQGFTDAGGEATLQAGKFGGKGPVVFDVVVGGTETPFHPLVWIQTPDTVTVDCYVDDTQERTSYTCNSGSGWRYWHTDHTASVSVADLVVPVAGDSLISGYTEPIEWITYGAAREMLCFDDMRRLCTPCNTVVADDGKMAAVVDSVQIFYRCKSGTPPAWGEWEQIDTVTDQGEGPLVAQKHWYSEWGVPSPAEECAMRIVAYSVDCALADETDGTFRIVPPPVPPSCPRLVGWTGAEHRPINSLFPLGGRPSAPERPDALRLPWLPDTTANRMRLALLETEAETTWVGTFALAILDHARGTVLAITQEGRPFLSEAPSPVDSLRASDGSDLSALLAAVDGQRFSGAGGDTVYFATRALAAKVESGPGGGVGLDGWKEQQGKAGLESGTSEDGDPAIRVEVFHPASGSWIVAAEYRPRDEGSTEIIDMDAFAAGGAGDRRARLVWTGPVPLDAVRVFREIPGTIAAVRLNPSEATHSSAGDVRPALAADDGQRVRLLRGERVDFLFQLPPIRPEMARDIAVVARGTYHPELSAKAGPATTLPASFFVSPARPNPASGVTQIQFGLPKPVRVALRMFDLSGRLIRTVEGGALPAGYHELVWDGRDEQGRTAAAGVYFYRVEAGRDQRSGRIVILR